MLWKIGGLLSLECFWPNATVQEVSLCGHSILFHFPHHLLLEVLLVALDVTIPWVDRLLVTKPDLFGNLSDKSEVVTNQYQASVEIVDRLCKCVDTFHIQVISWLIE